MTSYRDDIDNALDLYEQGRASEAVLILSTVCGRIPSSDPPALILVGSLLRDAGEFWMAIPCFEVVLRGDPLSARGSLGLFHSLWRNGQHLLALDELTRFYSLSRERGSAIASEDGEHNRLLEELGDSYFEDDEERPTDPLVTIQKLRGPFES